MKPEERARANKGTFVAIVFIVLVLFGVFFGILFSRDDTGAAASKTASSQQDSSSLDDNDPFDTNNTLFKLMSQQQDGDVPEDFCEVCGEGMEVGNPDAIFAFPGQPAKRCGDLQDEGYDGDISPDQCEIFPVLINDLCDCREIREKCSVCGEGKEVGNPDAIFAFPSQPTTSCGDLEQAGEAGNIDPNQCGILPSLISGLCECQPVGPAPTQAPSIPNEPCSVCGEGKQVGNPDGVFSFPSLPPVSCSDLEEDGEEGRLDFEQCRLLPALIDGVCECEPRGTDRPSSSPTLPAPTVSIQPSSSPRTPAPTQGPTYVPCSVCGEGKEVGNPNPIFSFPGTPPISCGDLETEGEEGKIPPEKCDTYPILIADLCECQSMSPSASPSNGPPSPPSPPNEPVLPSSSPSSSPTAHPADPSPSPTTSSEPSTSPTSDCYEYNLKELLPFLEEYADKEFYMVEVLYYNDRAGDYPYTELLNKEVFPSIGAQVVANGTILTQKDFTVVKYPNGTVFRQSILENQKVQDAMALYRRSSVYECHGWATTLVPKALVPPGLTASPMDDIPFPPPPGTPMTLFFHAISFLEFADYSDYTQFVPKEERQTTGREAVAKFDELATPLKSDVNGMRAVAWLDVQVTALGHEQMQQIRIETIPTLVGLGEAFQTPTWIKAESHRESGVTDATITVFANSTVDISQYYDNDDLSKGRSLPEDTIRHLL